MIFNKKNNEIAFNGKPIYYLFASLIFITVTISVPANAAKPSDFDEGKTLFSQKEYQKAYDKLFQAFLEQPDDQEINFYLGRAAYEKGDYETAVMAFDRILIVQPDTLRIKLELARSHMALKSYETARHYFQEVLDANPPKVVEDNILLHLKFIKQQEKQHYLRGMFVAGFTYDDNVRADPLNNEIYFPLIKDFVDIDQRPANDRIYSATLTLNHTYRPLTKPFTWQTDAFNYSATYQFVDERDTNYFGITTGPVFNGIGYQYEIRPFFNIVDLEHDRYLHTYGLEGKYARALNTNILFNSALRIEDKRYFTDLERNATTTGFRFGGQFDFGKNRVTLSAIAEFENASSSEWSYQRYGSGLRFDRKLPYSFNGYINFRYDGYQYDGINDDFNRIRNDDISSVSTGVTKRLWVSKDVTKSIEAEISYNYTNANSNIDLYTYDKHVTTSSIAFTF